MPDRNAVHSGAETSNVKSGHDASLDPEYLVVGEIVRPHGVRGELRMRVLTGHPERLGQHETLYIGKNLTPHRLSGIRAHRDAVLLRLEGISDREAAERLRGTLVNIHIADAVPLEEGEHYLFQLVGLHVITDEGRELGRLVDVIETGANDVYVVEGSDGQVLLPAIPDVVREVDVSGGKMTVHLIDGLLD